MYQCMWDPGGYTVFEQRSRWTTLWICYDPVSTAELHVWRCLLCRLDWYKTQHEKELLSDYRWIMCSNSWRILVWYRDTSSRCSDKVVMATRRLCIRSTCSKTQQAYHDSEDHCCENEWWWLCCCDMCIFLHGKTPWLCCQREWCPMVWAFDISLDNYTVVHKFW